MRKWISRIGLLLLVANAFWNVRNKNELEREQYEHQATRQQLAEAKTAARQWESACEEARKATEAHRQATQACLAREAHAYTAREEREAIYQQARLRPQSDAHRQQVVDDTTRARAADRLNRPL